MFNRMAYLSPLTTKIGQYVLPDNVSNILLSNQKQQALLKYLASRKFDAIGIYDLRKILGTKTEASLSRFIEAARIFGIKTVYGIAAIQSDFDRIISYQNSGHNGKFDGLLTEIEFWNEGTFESYLNNLKHMRAISNGTNLKIATYVGWFNRTPGFTEQQVANEIAKLADQVFVHAYVKDPASAYGYMQQRVIGLKIAKPEIEIYPIFSAEGQAASAGPEKFMGDWLLTHTLDDAETLVQNSIQVDGFVWFEHAFLRRYNKK